MKLFDGRGKVINVLSDAINTEDYTKNLQPIFSESFKAENLDFSLTNGTISDNGLACSGYTKCEYVAGTAIDTERTGIEFIYNSALSIGVAFGNRLAWLDGSTLKYGTNYARAGTAPTAKKSESVTFALTTGKKYNIELFTVGTNTTATLYSIETGEKVTITDTADAQNIYGQLFAVFSGSTTVTRFYSWLPNYNHVKALIVGDSITEGIGVVNTPESRCSWKLVTEYFENNGLISGVGGATTNTTMARVRKIVAMGYTFDYIIMCTGTNDGAGLTVAEYQTIVDELIGFGANVIWGLPPMRPSSETNEANAATVRSKLLQLDNVQYLRFDYATQTTSGASDSSLFGDGTHPNAAGHLRMFEFASEELEIMGV